MSTTTVRISEAARDALRELAAQSGASMSEMLDKLIAEYRRRVFFEQVDASYRVLRDNTDEWQAEMEERRLLEGTLGDGMDEQ